MIPRHLRMTKITSIDIGKGEKVDLTNDRGVHFVTKFCAIIDKLLYMIDCNVGGKRNWSIRDN